MHVRNVALLNNFLFCGLLYNYIDDVCFTLISTISVARTHKIDNMSNGSKERAENYLKNLLKNGSQEGDSEAELDLPPWYDEQLFKR